MKKASRLNKHMELKKIKLRVKYWVGQKGHSDFSVMSFGKI